MRNKFEFEFDCVYGSNHTRGTAYYYNGWYVVHGGCNINYTHDKINRDVATDIEEIEDLDICSCIKPTNSLEELARFIGGEYDFLEEE